MRQFGHRQFAGLAIPNVADVRVGVTYGPNSSLTGTLVSTGGGLEEPDLSDGNLSHFEVSEVASLNSYYELHGINAEYFEKAADESKWLVVCLLSRSESISYEGDIQYEHETIVVLLRRYSSATHYAVDRPAKGDRISIPSFDGTRKYTLTQTPVVSSGQLEWKAEFSRSKQKKVGGRSVVLTNS
jgi:hypothetical protein